MSPTILSNIYHLVRQFQDEKHAKKRLDSVRRRARQDSVFSANSLMVPLIAFASVLGLQTASLYLGKKHLIQFQHQNKVTSGSCNVTFLIILLHLSNCFYHNFLMYFFSSKCLDSQSQYKLENDPQCGLTNGGMEECSWDCNFEFGDFGQMITNPECLKDCFEDTPCVQMILDDPTCTSEKEAALREPECIQAVYKQQPLVYSTVSEIVAENFFGTKADTEWICFQLVEIAANFEDMAACTASFSPTVTDGQCPPTRKIERNITKSTNSSSTRLSPIFQTIALTTGGSIKTEVQFENTRNRYPWICSLRSKESNPEHYCAVTLLRRPPGPTVLVGAAHCTYLCKKSETTVVNACCCADGPESCSEDTSKCGMDPKVYEMTGLDSEIVCGEWETGSIPSSQSGEQYNVILPVSEIVRHPDFDTSEGAGPGAGRDIAVFKVNDQNLNTDQYSLLTPTCLPQSSESPSLTTLAVHSGWSKPPSVSFLSEFASPYLQIYRDFFKQWHYQMELVECKDPVSNSILGVDLNFPSDTFYPAGTVCAKEYTRLSCFTTGDSGSPLMIKQSDSRYYTVGFLSFIKGCDVLAFGVGNARDPTNRYFLNQESENPSVYTKLSCFLPWIARQYNLQYDGEAGEDCPAAIPKTISINFDFGEKSTSTEESDTICRNSPSNLLEAVQGTEVPCLFPFYYEDQLYESCVLFDQNDFVLPIFRCPIRDITRKYPDTNINWFKSDDLENILTGGLCQSTSTGANNFLILDPNDDSCLDAARRAPFSQCKNDCPGGRFYP